MSIQVVVEIALIVGDGSVVEGPASEGTFAAVFEDDGETGYFYAIDTSIAGRQILDAVHIYDVASVSDGEISSTVQIGWSKDNHKVMLLINDVAHAVFDFDSKRGYCRTGFPVPQAISVWSREGHRWEEACVGLFT